MNNDPYTRRILAQEKRIQSLGTYSNHSSEDMAETCDTCGRKIDVLGVANTDFGSYCGLCESEYKQNWSLSEQAVKLKSLASNQSTSDLLLLIRDGLLLEKLLDMLIGPNESVRWKFAKRLKRANLRWILTGRQYGYRPIFLLLDRAWTQTSGADLDCLDKVLDFITPVEDAQAPECVQQ